MAAVDLLRTPLPKPWSYGVTRDGRVFFVDDERRVTSWLHPVLGIAVQSGYNYTQDLPAGFEEGVTAEGVPYYVDHFHQTTSFHPPETRELHHTPVASHDTDSKSSNDSRKSGNKKKHTKQRILDKTPLAKRSPNSPVAKRGWLYHQEGAGLKTWKRRWCVLSDFCLFIYKNSEEDKLVESILLPSYKVSQCGVDDSVKREFAFKVEHENVRTYYLATDNKDSMASWMNVMGLATVLERDPSIEEQIRRHKSLTGEDDEGGFSDSRTRYPDAIPSDQSRYPDTLASDQSRYPDNLASDQVRYSDTLPSDVSRYPDPYPHDLGHYNDRRPENLFESYTSPEQDSLRESHRNAGYPGYSPNMSAPLREINNQDSVRSGNYGHERREEPVYQNVPQRNHLNENYPQQEAYKSQGHSPRSDLMNSHQSLASTQSNTPNQLTDDAKDYGKLRRGDANWDISDYEYRFGKHNLQSGVPEQTSKISPYADQPGLLGYRESYHDSYTSLENKENVHSNNAANRNDSLQRLQEWKQRMQRLSTSSIQSNNTTPRNRTQDRSPEQQALTVDTSSSPANHSPRYDQRQYSRNQNEADVPEARRGISASLDHLYPQDRYGSQDRFYSPGQFGSQQLGDYSAGRHGSQERLSDRNVSGTSHDDSFGPAPERPPLPAAYREQIALEMAATKTPASKQDLLLGVAGSRVRQNEPIFFQFPESPPFDGNQHQDQQLSARSQQTADSNVAHQRESVYPDSYQRARQQAETQWKADNTQQPTYPQSYLRAKYDDETHRQKASPSGHNGYPESYWNAYNSEHPDGGKYFEQQGLDRNQSGDHSYRDPAGNGSFQSPEGQSHQQGGTRPSPSQNSHHGAGNRVVEKITPQIAPNTIGNIPGSYLQELDSVSGGDNSSMDEYNNCRLAVEPVIKLQTAAVTIGNIPQSYVKTLNSGSNSVRGSSENVKEEVDSGATSRRLSSNEDLKHVYVQERHIPPNADTTLSSARRLSDDSYYKRLYEGGDKGSRRHSKEPRDVDSTKLEVKSTEQRGSDSSSSRSPRNPSPAAQKRYEFRQRSTFEDSVFEHVADASKEMTLPFKSYSSNRSHVMQRDLSKTDHDMVDIPLSVVYPSVTKTDSPLVRGRKNRLQRQGRMDDQDNIHIRMSSTSRENLQKSIQNVSNNPKSRQPLHGFMGSSLQTDQMEDFSLKTKPQTGDQGNPLFRSRSPPPVVRAEYGESELNTARMSEDILHVDRLPSGDQGNPSYRANSPLRNFQNIHDSPYISDRKKIEDIPNIHHELSGGRGNLLYQTRNLPRNIRNDYNKSDTHQQPYEANSDEVGRRELRGEGREIPHVHKLPSGGSGNLLYRSKSLPRDMQMPDVTRKPVVQDIPHVPRQPAGQFGNPLYRSRSLPRSIQKSDMNLWRSEQNVPHIPKQRSWENGNSLYHSGSRPRNFQKSVNRMETKADIPHVHRQQSAGYGNPLYRSASLPQRIQNSDMNSQGNLEGIPHRPKQMSGEYGNPVYRTGSLPRNVQNSYRNVQGPLEDIPYIPTQASGEHGNSLYRSASLPRNVQKIDRNVQGHADILYIPRQASGEHGNSLYRSASLPRNVQKINSNEQGYGDIPFIPRQVSGEHGNPLYRSASLPRNVQKIDSNVQGHADISHIPRQASDEHGNPEYRAGGLSPDLRNSDINLQGPSAEDIPHVSRQPSGEYGNLLYRSQGLSHSSQTEALRSPRINEMTSSNTRNVPGSPKAVHGIGQQASPRTNQDKQSHFIYTLKEDPDMSDSDILATRTFQNLQKTLNGHLRLSISAGDLIGKSHEELVLLLIQLRRQQAMLETAQAQCKQRLDEMRDTEKTYRRVRHNSVGALPDAMESEHSQYTELVNENSELLKKLEVFKPLVNLVDNLVTMGSLYGGDNLMLASQFKQHKLRPGQYTPPKKLVEFSRHLQEQKLAETHKHELQQLTEEEMDFEEKLQKLIELDRTLQDHSVAVASLQDDRDMLEKALSGLSKELDRAQYEGDSRLCDQLLQQQRTMEKEMSKVRLQLAEQSRILEEIATENARVEHEVMLLRKRVSGHLNRSISSPTLSSESARAKSRLERELSSIQSIMDGLNQQGAKLSEVMSTLRRSNPDLTESQPVKQTTYIETDMDTMESMDMANRQSLPRGGSTYSTPNKGMTRSSPQAHLPSSGRQLYQPVPAGGDHDSPTSYSHSRQQSYGFVVEENERVPTTETLQHSFQPFRRDHDNASDTRPQQQSFQPIERSFQPVGQTSYQSLDYPDRSAGQTSYQSLDHPDRSAGQSYQSLGHPDQSAGQTSYQSLGHIYDKSPDTHGQSSPDAWTSADISMATESDGFSPRDISEADDNTKRFYGLLPKEKPKYQTVRDIKKRETERRSRDRRRPLGEGNGDGSEAYMSDASVRGPEISAVRRSQSLPRNLSKADEPSRGPAPSSYTTRQPLQRDSYVRHSDRTSDRKPRPLASGSLRASTSRLPRKKRLSEISSKSAVERLYPHRNSVSQSESSMRSESENTHNASPYSPMSSESRDVADGQSSAAVSRVSLKDTDRFRDLLDTESSPMMTSSPHSTLTRNKATESPGNLGSSPLSQKLGSQSSFSGNFTKLHQGAPVGKVRPVLSSQESFLVRAQPAMVTSNVSYDVRDYDDLMRGQSSAIQSSRDKESQSHHSRDQSILSADLNSIARDHMYMPEKLSPRPSSVSPSHNASLSPGRVKTEHSSLTDDTKSSLSLQEDSKPSPHLSPRRQAFLEARKHTRGRFLTVSSSQPVTLEQHFDHRAKVQSAAGDLILPRSQEATIKTAEIMMTNFDEQTIDREVLHLPEKVEIPERYSPDSEDDADLSQEEQIERQKKAQRIKKMLAVHSLQEFSSEELHVRQGRVHQALEHEKKEREHVLDIRQALALEAKSKTRELAAQRRKTWSSETPGRHVEGAEDDGYNTMRSNADSSALYT